MDFFQFVQYVAPLAVGIGIGYKWGVSSCPKRAKDFMAVDKKCDFAGLRAPIIETTPTYTVILENGKSTGIICPLLRGERCAIPSVGVCRPKAQVDSSQTVQKPAS